MHLSKLMRAIDHPYLKGKRGRFMNNSRKGMQVKKDQTSKKKWQQNHDQGFDSWDSLKHHVGIQPLFVIFGGAMTLVASFVSLALEFHNCDFGVCQGGEEVRVGPWHQLGEDQGLGGLLVPCREILSMVLKDGSFYHEGPRMINANMEEHKDPRVRSS